MRVDAWRTPTDINNNISKYCFNASHRRLKYFTPSAENRKSQMKGLYSRLIMVTDTIPTLRTLIGFTVYTRVLKRQNATIAAPKFVVSSPEKRSRQEPIRDKSKCD